jgi:hypothetical protein
MLEWARNQYTKISALLENKRLTKMAWEWFCSSLYNNLRIMNTFFNHKNIHKCTWSARNSKSVIHCKWENINIIPWCYNVQRMWNWIRRLCNTRKIQDITKITENSNKQKEKKQCYKIKLLYDESIRWLLTQRVAQQIEKIPEHDDIQTMGKH